MDLKLLAAQRALDFVEDGMRLGLGTGSTTAIFLDLLGEQLRLGRMHDVCGVPTSLKTAQQAQRLGIPLISLAQTPWLHLAVDGADEVDPQLNLIKGLGKALLREKIVEIHARRFVVIVDESKLSPRLGSRQPLPVEIVPFEAEAHVRWLNSLGGRAELWLDDAGQPIKTDNGNYYARCWFEAGIPDVEDLAGRLANRPGIVEHGLFIEMATEVIVARESGVQIMQRGGEG